MRSTLPGLLLPLLLLPACTSIPAVARFEDTPNGRLSSMVWMAGSWIGQSQGSTWEAHYTSPAGGLMVGMTKRYGPEGNINFFEFETFRIEDGRVVVRPYLAGNNRVKFTLKTFDHEARRAVFENPDNDPTTLDYWRTDAETLVIAVTSPVDGEAKEGQPRVRGFRVVLKRPR